MAGVCLLLGGGLGRGAGPGRETVELSAGWRFQLDISDLGEQQGWYRPDFDRSRWGPARVPLAWDLFDRSMWGFEGLGWYALELEGALARPGQAQRLKFGRVNYHSKAWLNGESLGENTDGWMPFEYEVTRRLRPGQRNHLVLRVDNRPRPEWLPGATRIEWVQYGGILQPVVLETSAPVYVSDLTIVANTPAVQCAVEVRGAAERDVTLRLNAGGATGSAKVHITPGKPVTHALSLTLAGARQWSPESPRLYELTATLEDRGQPLDRVTQRFGIRRLEVAGRRVLLNGNAVRFQGVNRYDEYAPYGPNPPRKLVIEDLKRMKRAGVNTVRVHYPQAPELISLYDELGFLLIEELPINWWKLRPHGPDKPENDILGVALPTLERMIRRDKNHPSIVIWSMANESPTAEELGIRTMRRLLRRAKELDPTRLVTFVAVDENLKRHAAYTDADLVAANVYVGQFTGEIARHINQLEARVRKASTDYLRQNAAAFPDKPIIVTEFGTRGVPGIHGDVEYSEEFQAAFIQAAWKGLRDCAEASGGVLWCWADYYHRRDFIQYAPFGPYGVVTVDRRPKAALSALAAAYRAK
jgi:beta-glucuronidase